MKNAACTRFTARFLLTLALAATAVGWLPQEKGKRKMRMADATPVVAGQRA